MPSDIKLKVDWIQRLSWLQLRSKRLFVSRLARLADFPWVWIGKQFLIHYSGLIAGVVLTGYSVRYFVLLRIGRSLEGTDQFGILNDIDFVAKLDHHLATLFVTLASFGALWTLGHAINSARPMARLLRLSRRPVQLRTLIDAGSAEPGLDSEDSEETEWTDIERTMMKLSRGIQRREGQLSREREELVTILGAVNDGIVAMGRETEPLYFNSRFALLFGLQNSKDLELKPLKDRFRNPKLLAVFTKVLESGKTQSFRIRLRTALHDSEREFAVAVSPLQVKRSTRGLKSPALEATQSPLETYGAVAIFHDISELKQTEQIRVDFVANASHELRTPLTSIKGYVDTLIEDLKSKLSAEDDSAQLLSIVRRNVDRLIELVNDLLDLSTLESGAEVRREIVQTQEVTDHAVELLKGKHAGRISFRSRIQTPVVLGDAKRIEQVLVNLLDNASKYSPSGSEVLIQWERGTGSHAGETVLTVKDNGPGVSEDHLPRLFERFYRVDGGRAREVGGTGLGLAIVKHIVLAHGGSIAVRSEPGQGCEFICRFPRPSSQEREQLWT